MTDQIPRDLLIYARLLEKFEDDQDDLKEFIQGHINKGLDPTVDCADFYCQDARRYADDILDLFKRNQLGITHKIHLAEETFADGDELAGHLAAMFPGRWVALGVRHSVLGAEESPAKLVERFGHRSDVRLVYQERPHD